MKTQFWACYLALVLLLSGLAYIAISDASHVPLVLSDAGGVWVCVLRNYFDAARWCAATASDAGQVGDGSLVGWTGNLAVI